MKKKYIKPSIITISFNSNDIITLSSTKLQTGKYIYGSNINRIEIDHMNELNHTNEIEF